tara:strand:+ start:133 stop:468 length:336 start_codon:yes stop_codon:yes gene_type:complete
MLTVTILTNICWLFGVIALLYIGRKLNHSNSNLLKEKRVANWPGIITKALAYDKIVDDDLSGRHFRLHQEIAALKETLKAADIALPTESTAPVSETPKADAIIKSIETQTV